MMNLERRFWLIGVSLLCLGMMPLKLLANNGDCFVSFNVDKNAVVYTGNASVSCEKFEKSRNEIYVETKFDEKLKFINGQIMRIKKTLAEAEKQLSDEKTAENKAKVLLVTSSINSTLETVDTLDDCYLAVLKAKAGNLGGAIRQMVECYDEIDEAGEAVSDTIDKLDEKVSVTILKESSKILIKNLNELKIEVSASKRDAEAHKSKFLEMCAIVMSHCLPPKIQLN